MKNLILTDIMKSGHHWWYAQFLRYNSIRSQHIEIFDDYYSLSNSDLSKFDRKIAIICVMNDYLLKNDEYKIDLTRRINKLKQKGFKFILGIPWESRETSTGNQHIEFFSNISEFIWYGELNWFWFYMFEKNHTKNFTFNHSNKKYDFFYLNKQKRPHRLQLYNELLQSDLLVNSLYTFIGHDNKPVRLPLEYELPWVDRKNYPWYNHDQDIYEKPYEATKFNIVSETIVNDEIFFTEKIWKPILAQQPFVVHGSAGYLLKLRQLGFQTFHNFFDESYDDELDHEKRIKKIVTTLKYVQNIDYKKLYQETFDIRQHNKNLFWNKNELSNSINKTILNFFKFVDGS